MFKKRVLALFVMLQVVFMSMFPAPAYAATYAPEVVPFWGVTDLHVVQGVSNRFDAALGLIGEWGKKIQISNANYVALSNEGSGGAFYTLANAFSSADPNPIHSPEGVTGNPVAKVAWTGQIAYVWANYGSPADWLWYCNADDELISAARTDFLKVLAGESLGGGGGGGGASTNFSGYYHYINSSSNPMSSYLSASYGASGVKYYVYKRTEDATSKVMSQPFALQLNFTNSDFADFDKSGYDAFANFRFSNGYITDLAVFLFKSGSYTIRTSVDSYDSSVTYINSVATSDTYYRWYIGDVTGQQASNYTCDGSTVVCNVTNNVQHQTYNAGTVYRTMFFFGNAIAGGGGGDNHWPEPTTPEPDPQPTNPEPDPEPPDPPTYDPPTYTPPGFSPDVPVTIVPPDNTTAADYTPWLRAILTALNTIIDDLGEHCDHIRVAMRDYLSGMYEAISDDLESYYNDLTDYLSDLAKWIVSHLNFDVKQPDVNVNVPGYDDSSVVGWLRRIYYKLGGSGSPKPDPIEDTDGALDWWAKFLEWITNALGGLLTDFVGDLGGFLQELIDTFPFSIPWDIVAMLTLLDAQRATPDFTVTIPAQDGWWDDITVRINLAAYDDAMATVRGMMLIWWMFILVMKTDWMMLLFDGANNAISDFVSRLTGKG